MTPDECLLSSVLRGQPDPWPGSGDSSAISAFLAVARYHGCVPLLNSALCRHPNPECWPAPIRNACHDAAREQAMRELAHQAELGQIIVGLREAAIPALLLKGTGIAYDCYASPTLRPRADTDILVPPDARDRAARLLLSMGYHRVGGPAGRFVGFQIEMHHRDRVGVCHNIDLHWRISNLQYFAWRFSFDELAATAVPLPRLHPFALRLGNSHALMVNLLHRAGDNQRLANGYGDRLIGHYDSKLLIQRMSDDEVTAFAGMVEAKGVGSIVIEGLQNCLERFGSPRLSRLVDDLTRSKSARSGAALLLPGRLRREWNELCALPGTRARLVYLGERAFPVREYMRERYPDDARPLPLLHARRFVEGIARIRPSRRS